MPRVANPLEANGYLVLDNILSKADIAEIESDLTETPVQGAGSRNMLSQLWCAQLALKLKQNPAISQHLPENPVAVQCTYFPKSADRNWLVPLHRDIMIPVKNRFEADGWSAWSQKEGVDYVRPLDVVLNQLVAIRLHLEENNNLNGLLSVVPGSHINEATTGERITCPVLRGGALVMKPLLLHASAKLETGERRVLHFLFGPATLPRNVKWALAV